MILAKDLSHWQVHCHLTMDRVQIKFANYQIISCRKLYRLENLVGHILKTPVKLPKNVQFLYWNFDKFWKIIKMSTFTIQYIFSLYVCPICGFHQGSEPPSHCHNFFKNAGNVLTCKVRHCRRLLFGYSCQRRSEGTVGGPNSVGAQKKEKVVTSFPRPILLTSKKR